jgi:hypothetical protein
MNKTAILVFLFSLIIISSGCKGSPYGIRKDVWDTLTEAQKNDTILAYNKRETIIAETRLHDKKIEAAKIEETNKVITESAKTIIIKVTSGDIRYGVHTIKVTSKEEEIEHNSSSILSFNQSQKIPKLRAMNISYKNGILYLGKNKQSFAHPIEIPYNKRWSEGKEYKNLKFPSRAQFRGFITLHVIVKKKSSKKINLKGNKLIKKRSPIRMYRNVDNVFKKIF